jgi:hypothetical protein
MEHGSSEREACCIGKKVGGGCFRSVSVPMEEREEADDHGPEDKRRPQSKSNEHTK